MGTLATLEPNLQAATVAAGVDLALLMKSVDASSIARVAKAAAQKVGLSVIRRKEKYSRIASQLLQRLVHILTILKNIRRC